MQTAMAAAARGERCAFFDTAAAFSPRRAAATFGRTPAAERAPGGIGVALGRLQACADLTAWDTWQQFHTHPGLCIAGAGAQEVTGSLAFTHSSLPVGKQSKTLFLTKRMASQGNVLIT